MCVPAQWWGWGMLTSREGGWKGPGVSLRRSEERRRLRLLREDSERSHSLPREAELCHYKRKHSQLVLCSSPLGCCFQPLSESPLGAFSQSAALLSLSHWLPQKQWIQGVLGATEGYPWDFGGPQEEGQWATQVGGCGRQRSGGKG